jgi:hypothetical protein
MLERLARWNYRRRWWTLLIWIVGLVGPIALQSVPAEGS